MFFDLSQFIAQHVTGRAESLFKVDLVKNSARLFNQIEGSSVLVIGGAGSIGASFVKALLGFHPARLLVIDTNENALTELVRDLRSSNEYPVPAHFATYPVDFGDPVFEKIFRKEGPFDIVANFAAHKHVRSEKDHYSIEALLCNNVFKAKHLLDLLVARPPRHFFCVSTDKAANPVNIMGASKQLMEQLILSYATKIPATTARFANVAFSNGSLLSGFLERWMKKQPFSAPLDIERYFVSPEESGQLCLLACMLGEPGDIFFPKLDAKNDLRKFSDIATALLETLGYQADICASEQEAREKAALLDAKASHWPVYYFASDTTGEKAIEEFFMATETLDWNQFEHIGVIKQSNPSHMHEPIDISQWLQELKADLSNDTTDKAVLVNTLQRMVPNFQHEEKGLNLDQRM